MKIAPSFQRVARERAVAVEPAPAARVSDAFLRRLNHYPGRTLTRSSLDLEATHRMRHLALTGMERSAGVVFGLEVGLEPVPQAESIEGGGSEASSTTEVTRAPRRRYGLTISPGRGLCANGEDVVVPRLLKILVDEIPSYDAVMRKETTPPQGVGIVILQPISGEIPGMPDELDPCALDPAEEAYEDYRRVDGCRVVWMPWPTALGRLPAAGSRFRNALAYRIFSHEAAFSGADCVFPWDELGLPIALMHVARDGTVLFVDRWSVVRRGGAPRPKPPLFPSRGTPFLWQARIEQLHDHLRDLLASGLALTEVSNHVRYLPPVGIVPISVLDAQTRRCDFFPGSYRLEATPIPMEQVEWVVEAAASLKPVDLDTADALMLYLPVAQQHYDPKLLVKEQADPSLQRTIDALLQEIDVLLGRRSDLRDQAPIVVGSFQRGAVPVYPDPDPDAQVGETVLSEAMLRDVYKNRTLQALRVLVDETLKPYSLTPAEKQALARLKTGSVHDPEYRDLAAFIEGLDQGIQRSNDAVDLGFLKVQTDIYRMRQVLLGDEKATRLATSPILADIARGETSYATEQHLKTFFEKMKLPQSPEPSPRSAASSKAALSGAEGIGFRADPVSRVAQTAVTSRKALDLFRDSVSVEGLATREDVQLKNPIVGKMPDFRTTTVAERIADPLAPEAKNYAVATKADIVHRIQEIPIELSDVEVPVSDASTAVFPRAEFDRFREKYPNAVERLQKRIESHGSYILVRLKGLSAQDQEALGEAFSVLLAHRNVRLGDTSLPFLIVSGVFDPDPDSPDEPAFLAAGVTALESAVGILRRIEMRILDYQAVREQCVQCLKTLQGIAQEWAQALKAVDDALAEKRHDLVTARWLLEEENVRVADINSRRLEILKHHVPFIVYARPRRASITRDGTPRLKLGSVWVPAIPACLGGDQEAPDDLETMFRHLRAMPLAWFPALQKLLGDLNRPEKIRDLFVSAKKAAGIASDDAKAVSHAAVPSTVWRADVTAAAHHVTTAYDKAAQIRWENKAALDLEALDRLSFKELREQAEHTLSVNDLLGGALGRSQTARAAAQEVAFMEDVATCLYARTGRVPPAVRLLWAQKISQFDAPSDLRQLSVLPRWGELSLELRRDLQSFVDWLFSKTNALIPEALVFMNDVVRVALLLAAHAPVGQIVSGHAPVAATGRVGDRLTLVIDKGQVRLGMQVSVETSAGGTIRGIVDDMSGLEVRVKVTGSDAPTFAVSAGAKARIL